MSLATLVKIDRKFSDEIEDISLWRTGSGSGYARFERRPSVEHETLPPSAPGPVVVHQLGGIEERVKRLQSGKSHVEDVTSEEIRSALDSGRCVPTTGATDETEFDVAVVTVPTLLADGAPISPILRRRPKSLL